MRETILKVKPIKWSREEDEDFIEDYSKLTKKEKKLYTADFGKYMQENLPIRSTVKLFWDENIKEEMKELSKIEIKSSLPTKSLGHCHPVATKMALNYLGVDIKKMPNNREFFSEIVKKRASHFEPGNEEKDKFYNDFIKNSKNPNYSLVYTYSDHILDSSFKLNIFQENIENSLKKNVPVIFSSAAYQHTEINLGLDKTSSNFKKYAIRQELGYDGKWKKFDDMWGPHSVVIHGISIDEKDPLKTKYHILDQNIENSFNRQIEGIKDKTLYGSTIIDGGAIMSMSFHPYQMIWDKSSSNFIKQVTDWRKEWKSDPHHFFSDSEKLNFLCESKRYKKGLSKEQLSELWLKTENNNNNLNKNKKESLHNSKKINKIKKINR